MRRKKGGSSERAHATGNDTHLHKVGAHVLVAVRHPNALTPASLRGLHHHRVADAVGGVERLLEGRHLGLAESLLGDGALLHSREHPWTKTNGSRRRPPRVAETRENQTSKTRGRESNA